LPGDTALLLRGERTPGIHRVNVAIQNELQNQYKAHQRLSLNIRPNASRYGLGC
jgi:hypothetical protein